MKKTIILLLLLLTSFTTTTLASQAQWVKDDAKLNTAKKIIIFPAEGQQTGAEVTDYIVERSNKISNIQFVRAGTLNESLLKFTSEKERAQKAAAYADFYIVPIIREYSSQQEISPGKTVSVRMESWREIHSSEYNWTSPRRVHYEDYRIPETEHYLKTVNVDYYVYNTNGEPVLVFNKTEHTYDSRLSSFKSITKEFFDILKRATKN